jgi:thymidine kinase
MTKAYNSQTDSSSETKTTPTSGTITAITGCMFSGKTEELIKQIKRHHLRKRNYQIFKPALDNRYGYDDLVVSHNQQKLPATSVEDPKEILLHLKKSVQVVGIDEAQFFSEDIVAVMEELANVGIDVVLSGLDTDWQGRAFHPMPLILAKADYITKLYAVCSICGADATRTQRLVSSNKTVLVGAGEVYQARCRTHFDPFQNDKKELKLNQLNL